MARKKSSLTVRLTDTAIKMLGQVWVWNATQYGESHAEAYESFLKTRISKFPEMLGIASRVPHREGFLYLQVRKSSRGFGHIVVFSVDAQSLNILAVYHSRQNWQEDVQSLPT